MFVSGISALHSPVTLLAYIFEKFVKDSIHSNTIDILRKYNYFDFINNVMMYWTTNSILKTLSAYSGYLSFDESEEFESYVLHHKLSIHRYYELHVYIYIYICIIYFIYSQYNNFVGITLFVPNSVRPNIAIENEENVSVFCVFKNSRFPACEIPNFLSRAIFCRFKEFLEQNLAD